MKRFLIIFKGRVQGVGFRYKLYQIAYKYTLTGYCKNLSNGDVEVVIQGNNTDDFLKQALEKDTFIRIDDYSIKQLPIDENEKQFSVKY